MDEENLIPEGEDAGEEVTPIEQDEVAQTDEGEVPSLEDVASRMGWSPKDQWRGDPEKWKPAHEYISATADINHKLVNKLNSFEQRMGHMARTSAAITERAIAQERQRILEAREEAITMGDHDGVRQADRQLQTLPAMEPDLPPEAKEFKERNKWFDSDPEVTQWAINRAQQLSEQGLGAKRQLEIVEREAKGLFPDLFPVEKPQAKAVPLSQPGKRGQSAPQGKTYANLPPEAKKAADEFARAGRCSVEEYAKVYFEEQDS